VNVRGKKRDDDAGPRRRRGLSPRGPKVGRKTLKVNAKEEGNVVDSDQKGTWGGINPLSQGTKEKSSRRLRGRR